jgi:RecA-family ATPase
MKPVAATAVTPFAEAQSALSYAARNVALAIPSERIFALRDEAEYLGKFVAQGYLNPAVASDRIFEIAELHGLSGEPGSDAYSAVADIAALAAMPSTDDDPPPPDSLESYGLSSNAEPDMAPPEPSPLVTKTPAAWKGTNPEPVRWLAQGRIPAGDLTLYAGNGGAGKTETAVQLLVAAAADLGDWLGCVIEPGPALFLSCEEREGNIRDRVERICKHRGIDPDFIDRLHLCFPDLEEAWLVSVDRFGKVQKSPLFESTVRWIEEHRPSVVVIDSVAAVFDADAIARRQVRTFLATLRKVAQATGTAIVLLDHPSVRGMADGSGTANSVDWRNSVRSMLHLSDPDKDDPDVRTLEVKKSNYGKSGEKTKLRWSGLTFTTDAAGQTAPYRAAAELRLDDLFMRLLEERNAQGRWVTPSKAAGYAPKEFAIMPGAEGCTAAALANAMERLLTAKRIIVETFGPPSKQRQRLVVTPSNRLPTAE